MSVNILIAFEKAISLSASILIASADALIVAERPIMIVEKLKNLTLRQLFFLLSHPINPCLSNYFL